MDRLVTVRLRHVPVGDLLHGQRPAAGTRIRVWVLGWPDREHTN
jgi:hypothetical protein